MLAGSSLFRDDSDDLSRSRRGRAEVTGHGDDELVKANERHGSLVAYLPAILWEADEFRFAEQGLVELRAGAAAQGKDTAMLLGLAGRFASGGLVRDVGGFSAGLRDRPVWASNSSARSSLPPDSRSIAGGPVGDLE
jgi:hypothetical protein